MTKAQQIVEECFPVTLDGVCLKPLTKYLRLISSKWMIFTLMALPPDSTPVRYSEVRNRVRQIVSKKISDTTLSTRLNELVKENIVERKQFNEIPLRVEYNLTTKGTGLQKSLLPMIEWAISSCHKESKIEL
ncbi:MAG: winged helix-turn-helix transcriptional regulator [Candidatus Hodarchaeales archaeon]